MQVALKDGSWQLILDDDGEIFLNCGYFHMTPSEARHFAAALNRLADEAEGEG